MVESNKTYKKCKQQEREYRSSLCVSSMPDANDKSKLMPDATDKSKFVQIRKNSIGGVVPNGLISTMKQ